MIKPEIIITIHIFLYLFASLSAISNASYNFPLYLFGIFAIYYDGNNMPLRLFLGFSTFSVLLDIIWFILYGGGPPISTSSYTAGGSYTFAIVLTVVSLILKPVSVHRTWTLIKDRGDDGALHIDWGTSPAADSPLVASAGNPPA